MPESPSRTRWPPLGSNLAVNLVPGFAAVARDGEAQREGYQVALLGEHAPRTGKQGAARHDKGRYILCWQYGGKGRDAAVGRGGGRGRRLEILAGEAQRVARAARGDLVEHDHEQRALPALELDAHLLRVRPSHLRRGWGSALGSLLRAPLSACTAIAPGSSGRRVEGGGHTSGDHAPRSQSCSSVRPMESVRGFPARKSGSVRAKTLKVGWGWGQAWGLGYGWD